MFFWPKPAELRSLATSIARTPPAFSAANDLQRRRLRVIGDPVLRQRALLGHARSARRRSLGGGELVLMPQFLHEIIEALSVRSLDRRIVPEHLPLLRTLQFVSEYREDLFARDQLF